MTVLFEDNDIIVCLKPRGVLSQGDDKGHENMLSLLGGNVFPVHRLDRETEGVMVFAKNQKSAAAMSTLVQSHEQFRKEYLAVIEGVPEERSGELCDLLFHDVAKNKTYVVNKMRRGVKQAKLSYEVLETVEDGQGTPRCLVRVRLYTGRTHQIRVQFASRHVPLVGDRKYGGSKSESGLALFAYRLSFCHPITKEPLCFEAYPKADGEFSLFSSVKEPNIVNI
jgi:23S rRNA pseudouridine1911/1915/1917 synthase